MIIIIVEKSETSHVNGETVLTESNEHGKFVFDLTS
jgi:hypothetical protein